jgi:tRNA(fMet)-specific endonuclease VapC
MKQRYLLDTNICIYWLRDKYDVKGRVNAVGMENCYISEITIAELIYGREYGRMKGGSKHTEQKLEKFFEDINVLPIAHALELYGREKARLRIKGTPLEDEFDLLIGCSAVTEGMVLVTENVKDFKNIKDIRLENWVASHAE